MLLISSLVLILASAVAAVPVDTAPKLPAGNNHCAKPSLPGGAAGLPAPSGTLAFVTIGRGIQNYTCSGAGATPVAIGAVASLYDATDSAKCSTSDLDKVPSTAVNKPLPGGGDFMGMKLLGKHFFDAKGTPVFDVSSKILFAAKNGDAAAPGGASPGPAGTGAVDWLSLAAKTGYKSVGLKQAYRVETAGGKPKPCKAAGAESVQYAAQYWFYE